MVLFRIQGTNFSLTYPQSDFDLNACLEFLKSITVGSATVVEVIVCSERHEDGHLHRHAFVRFNRRIDLRDANKFDFQGRHANVQRTINVPAWKNYIREEGEFVEWCANPEHDNLFEWARTLTNESFWERCRRSNVSYGYARNAWDTVSSELNSITMVDDPNPDLNLVLPQSLDTFQFSTNLTNVIVGPTGCGKTFICLRKMLKPILFVTHVDQLKFFSAALHRSILFDDMQFTHLPVPAQIHLVDRALPRSIHRRYGTTLIPAGIQVTITCNERPVAWDPPINRRINLLTIN
nr:Rep [Trichosanthes kirilowii CRESS virus]